MTMYDISAMSATNDIDKALVSIDTYAESVIEYIDMAQDSLVTEGTADKPEPDKSIFDKIVTSIKNIFEKVASSFQKGKVVVHGTVQQDKLVKIASAVKDAPEIELKLQDVWKYSNFVDDLVEERIRKFKRKETLGLFRKVVGEGRAIDVLIRNLDLMTKQMHEPSNKQFYTKGRSPKLSKGAIREKKKISKIAVGAGAAVIAKRDILPLVTKKSAETAANAAATAGAAASPSIASTVGKFIFEVGLKGSLATDAAIVGGVVGLIALSRLFSNCPRKIGTEKISLKELYRRLVSLAPDKFPSIVKADLQNAAMYMTRVENLKEFAIVNDDSRDSSTVDYARKIAHLLGSYAKFHQGLIDFYLSIVVSALNESGTIVSNKIYKPSEMVTLAKESVEDDFEPFDLVDMLI